MHLMMIYFDLLVLLGGIYTAFMFPMENEVINEVYHELRNIVRIKTDIANEIAVGNETNKNETGSLSYTNNTSLLHPIKMDFEQTNRTRENDALRKPNIDSSDMGNSVFLKNKSSSINSSMISANSSDNRLFNNEVGTEMSSSNKNKNNLTNSNSLHEQNDTLTRNNSSEVEKINSSSYKPSPNLTKRHRLSKSNSTNNMVNEIQDILPSRVKRKEIQPMQMTNKVRVPSSTRLKRKIEPKDLLASELTNEIGDIFSLITGNDKEFIPLRTKRKADDTRLTNEINDISATNGADGEETPSIRMKRKIDEDNKKQNSNGNVELTNEIQDIDMRRRQHVHPLLNDASHANGNTFWKTNPNFRPSPGEAPNYANNHMHRDPHFVQNNQHVIPNDHPINRAATMPVDHANRQVKSQQENIHNNQDGHHHEQDQRQHHEQDQQQHHEQGQQQHHEQDQQQHHEQDQQQHHEQDQQQQTHQDNHHSSDWSSYHHGKYHHVKVKLHGPGKSPAEWAMQEKDELESMPIGDRYDSTTNHDPCHLHSVYLPNKDTCPPPTIRALCKTGGKNGKPILVCKHRVT